jgi:hypothetical protein
MFNFFSFIDACLLQQSGFIEDLFSNIKKIKNKKRENEE